MNFNFVLCNNYCTCSCTCMCVVWLEAFNSYLELGYVSIKNGHFTKCSRLFLCYSVCCNNFIHMLIPIECQTEVTWCTVEEQISLLEAALHQRPEFSVSTNDKLTQFYTGMPTYDTFVAFFKYLEPKALHLQPWRGSETVMLDNEVISIEELNLRKKSVCFSCLLVANQLFAV